MDSFYVTLFSNSSQNIFPTNSSSKFTLRLPKPLDFKNEAWSVGLVDIMHPVIEGHVVGDEMEQDLVKFPPVHKQETTKCLEFEPFIKYTIFNSRKPEVYSKRYFHSFLNIEFLKEFQINEALSRYKTTLTEASSKLGVKLFEILPQFRDSNIADKKHCIFFNYDTPYTMRQILWRFLDAYYNLYLEAESNPAIFSQVGLIRESNKTIAEALLLYATSFMNKVREIVGKRTSLYEHSNYLLIYADFIKPSIVGNTFARLLYSTMRKKDVNEDLILVQHVKYLLIEKIFIEDVSYLFADEQSRQIKFEDGYLPTSLVLHFKRI